MSRIGKSPIPIPDGVTVECAGDRVQVKGPKGSLASAVPERIAVAVDGGTVSFKRSDDRKVSRALHGLARAVVANMVTGVTVGFSKNLEIEGVGYRADLQGKQLNLAVGFSHPVSVRVPDELKVSLDGNTKIRIEGIDKRLVGQFAADLRGIRPPESYKGKGIRYADERVRRKVGKAGVT